MLDVRGGLDKTEAMGLGDGVPRLLITWDVLDPLVTVCLRIGEVLELGTRSPDLAQISKDPVCP